MTMGRITTAGGVATIDKWWIRSDIVLMVAQYLTGADSPDLNHNPKVSAP